LGEGEIRQFKKMFHQNIGLPLKNKTGTEVAGALQKVFKERKPEKLWVDKGKEFYNKHV